MKRNYLNIPSLLLGVMMLFASCEKEDVKVESIALNKITTSVEIGATETLSIVFTPIDASNKDILWSTSDATIAAVSEAGVVTGIALGTATITATSKENATIKSECIVHVIPVTGTTFTISGNITADTKWFANAKYMLSGFVYVQEGVTLTIEPGTVIKGVVDSKASLIIKRGAKIMAAGTASAPIVFTSGKPAGSRNYGDWGGIVICGKAPTNKADGGVAGQGQAEGGIDALYGGNDPADNSGVLQYVRIEFPGIALTSTANSEINGLTLYSVGSGTTIDHIQISYSGDDSFEWFGGTVNAKYLVAFRGWDDDFDTDNGFIGKVQFIAGLRDPNASDQSGSNGFESDNDANGTTTTPITHPTFSNVTLFGPLTVSSTLPANHLFKRSMHIRRSSQLSVYNSVFVGYPKGLIIDGEKGNSPAKADDNTLQIENCVMAAMTTNYEVSTASTQATPYTLAQLETYFTTAAKNNSTNVTLAQVIGANLINLTNPSWLPVAGSPVLTGASFTNANLTSSFFTTTTYKGAFGTENWTSGWCNFDPQNTVY